MTVKSKGITKFIIAKDAQLLPAPDVPAEVAKRQHVPDPLKKCVLEMLGQGGRSEEEATAWCKDFLESGGESNSPTSIDAANNSEAVRIMVETRRDITKPREIEQCIKNRQNLFGEGEWTAGQNCRRDWELGERVRGSPEEYPRLEGQLGNVRAVATDGNEPISMIHRELDAPEAFQQLERLRIALDRRTEELTNQHGVFRGEKIYTYTPKEAEWKARKELGLPIVSRKPEPDVTVPDATGKSKEQRLKESYGADTERRRPGEKPTTVPNLYGKSHDQIVREALDQHAED